MSQGTNEPLPKISVPVINRDGADVGTVEIDPAAFGGRVNRQLIQEVVLMYRANQRAGTHSTLRRGEVAGSTKKVFRQKGTGNARIGTKRTNKRRGGGTAKGPKPRDYEYHLPKKAVRAATRMAILSKFLDNEAVIIDEWKVDGIKTKPVAGVFRALTKKYAPAPTQAPEPAPVAEGERPPKPAKQKRTKFTWLVGTADYDTNLYMSARNLPDVEVMPAGQFNCYTVLKQKRLILTRAALEALLNPAPAKKPEAEPAKA